MTESELTAGVLIARSQPHERCDVLSGSSWMEYRVRSIGHDEYNSLARNGLISRRLAGCTIILEDRVFASSEGEETAISQWRQWNLGFTVDSTIWDVLGDSQFLAAESLHECHAKLATLRRELAAAEEVKHQAFKKVQGCVQSAQDVVWEANQDYEKYLKKYAGEDLNRAVERLKRKHQPRIDIANANHATAKAEYVQAVRAAELILAKVPQ